MMIDLNEKQFHAFLLPAITHRQAICVRNANVERLRALCAPYDKHVEVVAPFPSIITNEQQLTLVRLMRPEQRLTAMVVAYWDEIPLPLLRRLIQVRLA